MITESTGLPVGGKFTYSVEDLAGITINGKAVEREEIRVSGLLESHYAPIAKVVIDRAPLSGEGFIAMAGVMAGNGVIRLAAPESHQEFARVLYAALRAADHQGLHTVVVEQPSGDGIAVAIRDRLKRAAHSGSYS